jgi:hypothetical protein
MPSGVILAGGLTVATQPLIPLKWEAEGNLEDAGATQLPVETLN